MHYRRSGFPQEHDIVLCTVSKISFHSVFVKLDEYDKQGMLHISEVSPGRIRNLRDYVKEGKKIICKVLGVNEKNGHIDLSLRRVNEGQRREKSQQIKQELKAEKILENIAKELKKDAKKLYDEVTDKVFEKYEYLFVCFEDAALGKVTLKSLGIEEKIAKKLEDAVKLKIKPQEVEIKGKLALKTFEPNGAEIIRNLFEKLKGVASEGVEYHYLGNGAYKISIVSLDFKDAEKILKKIMSTIDQTTKKKDFAYEFTRI